MKHKTKYASKNSLEQVLELLNKYIVQIAYSYNSYKFYISGVITRRKKVSKVGLLPREYNSFKGKEAYSRNFQNYGLVHKIMDNKKKRQENNFLSVHKKNKAY